MNKNSSQKNTRSSTNFTEEKQLVVFKLKNEEFGIQIERVREIVRIPEITHLPRAPEFLCGISNLRGDIMPIIDTRKRFSMPETEVSDRARVLVVDIDGTSSGLVVDEVSEVMRVPKKNIDGPPAAVKGIERHFLEGIVKVDNGKRVIMTLNLNEILSAKSKGSKASSVKAQGKTNDLEAIETIDEEQIISLKISSEEYGFPISKVREILRLSEITEVPNVPEYVKGLITVRNNLLPILDMRTMLGKKTWVEEVAEVLTSKKQRCETLIHSLESALGTGVRAITLPEPDECEFGRWIDSPDDLPGSMIDSLKELRSIHNDLHKSSKTAIDLLGVSPKQARRYYEEHTLRLRDALDNRLATIISLLDEILKEEQRILVIETGGITLGLLVDTVNEVVRVPKTSIDDVLVVSSAASKELRGVAKLDNGKRLIMIMNESSFISNSDLDLLESLEKSKSSDCSAEKKPDYASDKKQIEDKQNEDIELLSQIGSDSPSNTEGKGDENMTEIGNVDLHEVQLVTFNLGEEEFGLRITDVQEINRLGDITQLPKAPEFVEGVTNLRGDVVPVIDLRKRFGMPPINRDDRTRIIISDIGGRKTGFIVDRVNEVMRIPKKNIEGAERVVAGMVDSDFVEGLGKVDEQRRMIILLNLEKILTQNEIKMLENMDAEKGKSRQGTRKKASNTKKQKNSRASKKK